VRRDFDGSELEAASTPAELAVSVVRQQERRRHRASRETALPSASIESLIRWAAGRAYLSGSALDRIAVERERAGGFFGRFDGIISEARLIEMGRERLGAEHVFSASELGLYGKCPYKFFAQRVLRLEPRGEAAMDLTALDAGSLLHEILRRFLARHRNQPLTSFDRGDLTAEVAAVADEVFDEHERVVPPLNPNIWRIDREIRKIVLNQVLDFELELERKTENKQVRPAYFEWGFGMKRADSDPASVEALLEMKNNDEAIRLRGQIDRVDLARDQTAIAYDYKLSRGSSLEDMIEGRDVSLHVYLAAIEQILLPESQIAGGGYYVLRGAVRGRNRGLYRQSKSEYTGVTGTRSTLSDDDWLRIRAEMQARIWEFVDGMRAGRFQVEPTAPKQSCPFCDYAAVCRYEKFRISHKKKQPRKGTEGSEPERPEVHL